MPTFSPEEYEASGLGGIVWQWMRLDFSDGTSQSVDDPSKYTIPFMPDGTIAGNTDCNLFAGGFLVQGSSLQMLIGPMTTTRPVSRRRVLGPSGSENRHSVAKTPLPQVFGELLFFNVV